jgi:predicted dithiol-disulfide oxidoreductase (DUF899 family)
MNYSDARRRREELGQRIADIRVEMQSLLATTEPQVVQDYRFASSRGELSLSQLFGDKADLFVIHNMGRSCPYCTLWADGYNGVYEHLASRAVFVMSSPDPPAVQREFAAGRGWKFPMVSHQGTSFAQDMGYRSDKGNWLPGVSVFQRQGGRIVRVADSGFHPGDDFCAVWHFFDLLPQGRADWQARFAYDNS